MGMPTPAGARADPDTIRSGSGGTPSGASSPMASLVLTDSWRLTADGFEKLPDQIIDPYAKPYDLQKHPAALTTQPRTSSGCKSPRSRGDSMDLSYVTERIIALWVPGDVSAASYRQGQQQAAHMLHTKHGNNYMVFNLSEPRRAARSHHEKVQELGWPPDLAPPLERLCKVCKDIDEWLSGDSHRIAVIHASLVAHSLACSLTRQFGRSITRSHARQFGRSVTCSLARQFGRSVTCSLARSSVWPNPYPYLGSKERIGVVIAAYMHYSNICGSADQALDRFAMSRFLNDKIGELEQPSHKRYVEYFSGLLSGNIRINSAPLYLTHVTVLGAPSFEVAADDGSGGGGCRAFLKVSLRLTYTLETDFRLSEEQYNYGSVRGPVVSLFVYPGVRGPVVSLFVCPQVYEGLVPVYTSGVHSVAGGTRQFTVNVAGERHRRGLQLRGDILLKCYHRCYQGGIAPPPSHAQGAQGSREMVFSCQFHTCAVTDYTLSFTRQELDHACNDLRFPLDGAVELHFSPTPEVRLPSPAPTPAVPVHLTDDPVTRWDSYENITLLESPDSEGDDDAGVQLEMPTRRGFATGYKPVPKFCSNLRISVGLQLIGKIFSRCHIEIGLANVLIVFSLTAEDGEIEVLISVGVLKVDVETTLLRDMLARTASRVEGAVAASQITAHDSSVFAASS
uniref:(California timema) hypothetical protein n=1 Tax=Timema californicum TaxID=61474 RepID=A0A7R9J8P0_TIMCA|nr:unnamed protein product [Timema californicum]